MAVKILTACIVWFFLNVGLIALLNAHPKSEEERKLEDEEQTAYLQKWMKEHGKSAQ